MNSLEEIRFISIESLIVNPYQPRREFNQEDLTELAQSIQTVGLLHPPLVRPLEDGSLYELISGERRYRAAQLAGLTTIPVLVQLSPNLSASWKAQAALIENIQRVDLNPLEIAEALKILLDEFEWNQEQLSQKIGKKRSTLANYLRLLSLPAAIKTSLQSGILSMGHAKAILALDSQKQIILHEMILKDQMNVRQTEKAAAKMSEKNPTKPKMRLGKDVHISHLETQLQQKFGTKVSLQNKEEQGKIVIDYYSFDDLDRLLELWNVTLD